MGPSSAKSMGRFQITLVRPQECPHTDAFGNVAETLQFGLRSLGHSADIQENLFEPGATNVFLGAHRLSPQQAVIIPPGSVLYNLEQLDDPNLPPHYCDLARQYVLWDYSLRNLEKWKTMPCVYAPVHVPLGYAPELSRIRPAAQQDIDVLFCGPQNGRGVRVLNSLQAKGVKVHTLFSAGGENQDQVISRSKIVLYVHFREEKIFDLGRVFHLFANSKAIVAESSAALIAGENDPAAAVLSAPYDSLVDICLRLLRNEDERGQLETRGFQWFSQQKETEILCRALEQSEGPMTSAASPAAAQPTPAPGQTRPTEPQVTHISRTTESPLVRSLQAAFNQALAGRGALDPAVLAMDGMSGRKYRMLINNLIKGLDHPRYLEIGTWAGSTLCSAINGNDVRATAIDNWSEFGGPKAQFLKNLERFKTPSANVSFLERDFRSVDYTQLGRFSVYMFDGPHTASDQFDGIALVQPALDDEFILIVDDWNHTPAREGTMQALHALNLSIVHSYEIRTTLDGSHPTVARQASDWHNGYLIAVVAKPGANTNLRRVEDPQLEAARV